MKNILMIATGGTIASKEGDLGLTPAVTGEELAASVPGIKDICHLEILQLMNIDSTNMRPRQWLMIRDAIMENYNHYDGFVILHGTDTMAYTAAALSYLIQDSVKPIVLTGSQKPMANPYTDAKINLFQSILYAADDLSCNVCIVFNGKVVAGTRGRKQRTRSFDAFDSMNFPELAIIRDSRIIRYYTEKRPAPQDAARGIPLRPALRFDEIPKPTVLSGWKMTARILLCFHSAQGHVLWVPFFVSFRYALGG